VHRALDSFPTSIPSLGISHSACLLQTRKGNIYLLERDKPDPSWSLFVIWGLMSEFVLAGIRNVTSEVYSTYTGKHVEMDGKRWSISNGRRVQNGRRVGEAVDFVQNHCETYPYDAVVDNCHSTRRMVRAFLGV
jgi:hypothetical protein